MNAKDICVLGGRGFVGSAVTSALRRNGHTVTTMDPHIGGDQHVSASILSTDLDAFVEGFDTVVNLVGLSPMKQPGVPGYHDLHVAGAENVVGACQENDIDQLVHMSALGADPTADTVFLRTKGEAEETVLDAGLDVTVIRPSMIFDHGSELIQYAQLFKPLRMFPRIPVEVQPVYREDVATLFAQTVEDRIAETIVEVGGPNTMTLFTYVKQLYNAQGYACYPVPVLPVMKAGLYMAEYMPFIPFGRDQARFLSFTNTTQRNDAADYINLTAYDAWLQQEFPS